MTLNLHGPGLEEGRSPGSALFPWYDSRWLTQYVQARAIIEKVSPASLGAFEDALRVLRTRPDFRERVLDRPFDDQTLDEIQRVTNALRPLDLQLHEAQSFGRFVVHDHSSFTELHHRAVPWVSEAVGEPVEPSYSFLGLYGSHGVCPPHLDDPLAKWTLDLCIDQSAPWPIHFSKVVPWPDGRSQTWPQVGWEDQVKRSLRFSECTLRPGQAVVFSGSSQWHFRDAMPSGGGRQFCDLLFFHFIPRGTAELVKPKAWARLFGIPELDRLS